MTEIILQHEISYFFRNEEELKIDECNIEHIENCIKEGFNQGELCQYDVKDNEYRGWWKIVKQ